MPVYTHGVSIRSVPDGVEMSGNFLRSDRLTLQPARVDQLLSIWELWTTAHVNRYLFDARRITMEEARSHIETSETTFREYGYGIWLTYLEPERSLCGFAGLLRSAAADAPNLVVGTRVALCGLGLATEAAEAVLDYARDVLKLAKVVADVDEPNLASRRVLEKIGMSLVDRRSVQGRPLLYYERQLWNLASDPRHSDRLRRDKP